ncbi:hypothetical protein HYALB_00009770 [Hymenoscyphus albidus]|uniref:Uncharacterized protein n=1 Tax=Hymenoscyphus albidus TaxID=595503 RepID=A0A9N9LQT7_9HELO|nr:hypothetical protein HYALB_00009770 [Hymenoscyphus albidus]
MEIPTYFYTVMKITFFVILRSEAPNAALTGMLVEMCYTYYYQLERANKTYFQWCLRPCREKEIGRVEEIPRYETLE